MPLCSVTPEALQGEFCRHGGAQGRLGRGPGEEPMQPPGTWLEGQREPDAVLFLGSGGGSCVPDSASSSGCSSRVESHFLSALGHYCSCWARTVAVRISCLPPHGGFVADVFSSLVSSKILSLCLVLRWDQSQCVWVLLGITWQRGELWPRGGLAGPASLVLGAGL